MPNERKNQTLENEDKKSENKAEGKETATKDFEIWFPKIKFIDTIYDERIKIPVLSAGKEAKVFQCLARLLEKLPKKELQGDLEQFAAADLLSILPNLLEDAPKEAFSIASEILTSKEHPIDDKWVQDNLNFDKIFDLIIPFVAGEAKLFEKVSGLLSKMSLSVNF